MFNKMGEADLAILSPVLKFHISYSVQLTKNLLLEHHLCLTSISISVLSVLKLCIAEVMAKSHLSYGRKMTHTTRWSSNLWLQFAHQLDLTLSMRICWKCWPNDWKIVSCSFTLFTSFPVRLLKLELGFIIELLKYLRALKCWNWMLSLSLAGNALKYSFCKGVVLQLFSGGVAVLKLFHLRMVQWDWDFPTLFLFFNHFFFLLAHLPRIWWLVLFFRPVLD